MHWFGELFALAGESAGIPARAYFFRGWLSMLQIDPVGARPWLAKAIAAARSAGRRAYLSEALSIAATAEDMAGDIDTARRLLDDARTVTAELDDYAASVGLLEATAIHALFEHDLDLARATSLEGVRLSREAGDLYHLERLLQKVGIAAMTAGDFAGARATFIEELQIASAIDNRVAQYYLLSLLGGLAGTSGQPRLAAQLLGAAEALGSATGAGMMGASEPLRARAEELSRSALGASRFAAEYAGGKQLSRTAALSLALGESEPADQDGKGTGTGPLAKRELEVALLIAKGLTNKEIGQQLFISERTVATHVRNILNKLGFDSRAQVAAWVASG